MTTYFLPATRASQTKLKSEVRALRQSPVVVGLMTTVTGLLAVLNEHRQIVAVNKSFLNAIGGRETEQALGLRPGEAIRCVHAKRCRGGCGTSEFCRTCGAAIAIAACQATKEPSETACALQVEKEGAVVDLFFRVRCTPITSVGNCYYVLALEDARADQQVAALQRVFFHDINHLISGLVEAGGSASKRRSLEVKTWTDEVYDLSLRLAQEASLQGGALERSKYKLRLEKIPIKEIVKRLRKFYRRHPVALGRTIVWPGQIPSVLITTDAILLRVLTNMLTNALEATAKGGKVKLLLNNKAGVVTFSVWNKAAISPDVALRVFQRNFSTKAEPGRGLGTYFMKLFGERILGGKVEFQSSKSEGTTFQFTLPDSFEAGTKTQELEG